ncbi:hypothetical protein [Vreelandella venusta]|uniref:hypothetical protein n=1 Tax=Vreelandella venusta TaxID=44935 RepID=UPI002010A215|nr:hypothetical protein [Halomonas venusta]UQI42741.1 hypothetical protein M3L73_10945 [Halomonas venusta]
MFEIIAGVFALLIAIAGVLLKQRNNARKKADSAERKAEQIHAAREKERAIDNARAQARQKSAETQREADTRPSTERPTGSFRR